MKTILYMINSALFSYNKNGSTKSINQKNENIEAIVEDIAIKFALYYKKHPYILFDYKEYKQLFEQFKLENKL